MIMKPSQFVFVISHTSTAYKNIHFIQNSKYDRYNIMLFTLRIWRHLMELANTRQTTVIVTTHYIEEAKMAHTVRTPCIILIPLVSCIKIKANSNVNILYVNP